jgi:chromosomal replication initiator protein
MNPQQAWQATLGQLQMEMSKAAFDTWVRNAELVSYDDETFKIGVQNAYARDWLDSRLSSTVTRLLTGMMNRPQSVDFVVWQENTIMSQKNLRRRKSSAKCILTTIIQSTQGTRWIVSS